MKVQELLNSPEKWTKEFFAKTADGDCVEQNHPGAVCFCLLGAIYKCYGPEPVDHNEARNKLIAALRKRNIPVAIAVFNDMETTTFELIQEIVKEDDI